MQIQKLANLEQLTDRWTSLRRNYFQSTFKIQIFFGFTLLSVLFYALTKTSPIGLSTLLYLLALGAFIIFQYSLYYVSVGRKPTQQDVENNKRLRRVMNMDDTVNGE